MRAIWLLVFCMYTLQAQAAVMETITQTTTGSCSPVVGKVGGSVTITCQGLDDQALARLNEFLEKKFAALWHESSDNKTAARLHELLDIKDRELRAKIREAEEWAQKYRELEQRLATQGQDEPLAQLAKALLKEGKLDEAGVILDRVLETGEKGVEQTAANHFNRAEVYALKFQSHKALPHYEKAYRYQPDKVEYAFRYAQTLQQLHSDDTTARMVYQKVLAAYRQLAQANPQLYLPYVAKTLTNLGALYHYMRQVSEAEQAYQEALTISRQGAQANPQAYLPEMAETVRHLGFLYRDTQRRSEEEQIYQEALTISRQGAQTNPQAFLRYVGYTLDSLGLLYGTTQRFSEAEQAYQEALTISRQDAQTNPQAYHLVAVGFNNLGAFYREAQRFSEAEQAFGEAVSISRQFAQTNNPDFSVS